MKTYLLTALVCMITSCVFSQKKSISPNSPTDTPAFFLEKADFYHKKAQKNDKKNAQTKKMIRSGKKAYEKDVKRYNEYQEGGNEVLIEKFRKKVEKGEETLKKLGEMMPPPQISVDFYQQEAIFREKYIESLGDESPRLANYFKLGISQYKSKQYKKASESFDKVLEFRSDYISAHQYQMQIAYYQEVSDTTSNEWLAIVPATKIIKEFEEIAPSKLNKKQRDLLLVAYEVMVFYSFNPTGAADNYHCEDSKPWIEKVHAINPDYQRIRAVSDYCSQVKK